MQQTQALGVVKTVKQILKIVRISSLAMAGEVFGTDSEKENFIKKQKRGWTLKFLCRCFLTVFLVGLVSSVGFAVTRTWDGGGGDNNWGTAANWSDDTAPADGDDAMIVYSVRPTINIAAEVASLTSLTIDASPTEGEDITLTVSADLGAAGAIAVNITGSGDVTINGSSAINATTITVGVAAAGNTGTFTLSGAGTTTTSGAVSITSGAGDFTLDRSGAWSVGGTMDLTASGNGSITMTLGANSTFTGNVTLGASTGGTATLNLGNNLTHHFSGDFTIQAKGRVTYTTTTYIVFDGTTTLADNNDSGSLQNLGNVTVD